MRQLVLSVALLSLLSGVPALAATAPVPVAAPEPVVVRERSNDKFAGSLGLFLLRLVVAAIFTVRGIYMLSNLVETQEQFAQTLIPYPQVMAIATGVAALLIALSLVLGLLTRVAGLGVALIAGGALAFVLWERNDREAALRKMEQAIALDPKYATARHWYALFLQDSGRHADAVREGTIARSLDASSPVIGSDLAIMPQSEGGNQTPAASR